MIGKVVAAQEGAGSDIEGLRLLENAIGLPAGDGLGEAYLVASGLERARQDDVGEVAEIGLGDADHVLVAVAALVRVKLEELLIGIDNIAARAAEQDVAADAAVDEVVAGTAVDIIVAGLADHPSV